MTNEERYAYLAGYLESRNSFYLGKGWDNSGEGRNRYRIRTYLRDENETNLLHIQLFYGGKLYKKHDTNVLQLKPSLFDGLINDVAPYCFLYKERVNLLLEMMKIRDNGRQKENKKELEEIYIKQKSIKKENIIPITNDLLKDNFLFSYLAGAIDGHSYINIHKNFSKHNKPKFNPILSFINKNVNYINFIKTSIQGFEKINLSNCNGSFKLTLQGFKIYNFLNNIQFYLKGNYKKIQKMLEFMSLRLNGCKEEFILDRYTNILETNTSFEFAECNTCNLEKHLDEFYKKDNSIGRSYECKSCGIKKSLNYYEENKEECREMVRNYNRNNREKINEKRKNNIEAKLIGNHRKRIRELLRDTDLISQSVGCSGKILKEWIESQWEENMFWQNYGCNSSQEKYWEIDHFIAICRHDLSDKEQVQKAFNYKNLKPIWINAHREKTRKDIKIKYNSEI